MEKGFGFRNCWFQNYSLLFISLPSLICPIFSFSLLSFPSYCFSIFSFSVHFSSFPQHLHLRGTKEKLSFVLKFWVFSFIILTILCVKVLSFWFHSIDNIVRSGDIYTNQPTMQRFVKVGLRKRYKSKALRTPYTGNRVKHEWFVYSVVIESNTTLYIDE